MANHRSISDRLQRSTLATSKGSVATLAFKPFAVAVATTFAAASLDKSYTTYVERGEEVSNILHIAAHTKL
jgi:hypothetical protein